MQTDTEPVELSGARNRIVGSISANHQARGSQNAIGESFFDRVVDGGRTSVIVGCDDQLLQAVFSRPQRKRKNSTPSRNCRFMTFQSLHIS